MYNLSITKETPKSLSYTEIFQFIGEDNIYFKYFGKYPSTKDKYKSPFASDSTPSLSFRMYDKRLIYKCFSTNKGGDAISFVAELNFESYADAAKRITNDFYLQKGEIKQLQVQSPNIHVKYNTQIRVSLQDFCTSDLAYFQKGGVTKKTIDFFDVKVVNKVFVNKGQEWYTPKDWYYTKHNPIFRYKVNGRYKLYRPLEPDSNYKWISNTIAEDIQGFDQLPEFGNNLIITKSMKDIMCWKELGFPAISRCTESQPLTNSFLNFFYKRFPNIYINYDFDKSGIREAEKYSLPKIFTNNEDFKDPFALISGIGYEPAKEILLNQISTK